VVHGRGGDRERREVGRRRKGGQEGEGGKEGRRQRQWHMGEKETEKGREIGRGREGGRDGWMEGGREGDRDSEKASTGGWTCTCPDSSAGESCTMSDIIITPMR
jgi:hypothetical protein